MRIGVFGGTFDPPHLAHLILVDEARQQLELARVLWVLTPDPPHKEGRRISAVQSRLEMLSAALEGDPGFELSRVDIDRPSPHYAVETMRLLAVQYPGAKLVYLMGGESLRDLPLWYDPDGFLHASHELGVMPRPGAAVNLEQLEDHLPGLAGKLRWIDAPLLEISSSDLRWRVAQGQPFRYFMPPSVYEIIKEKGLYRQA